VEPTTQSGMTQDIFGKNKRKASKMKNIKHMADYELKPIIQHANGDIEHCARVCDVCKKGMIKGYVLWDGEKYACSDKCLYKLKDGKGDFWTLESFSDYFEQEESENENFGSDCYWTDWEECDEQECHICEAIVSEDKWGRG